MAGHSKWANIKHRKGTQDKRRSKLFTRILKDVYIAAKNGGPAPESNTALRLAIQNGRGANIPKDRIEAAIKKASGKDAQNFDELSFEGYGLGGVGVFIEAATDNSNRTIANIRTIFTKGNGSLGTNGSLSFIFSQKGVFTIPKSQLEGKNMEEIEFQLIDGGAEEIEMLDEFLSVTTSFEDFGKMQRHLETIGIEAENASLQRIPSVYKTLSLPDAIKFLKMIEKFEEDEDISAVYHNLEITPELAQHLEQL